MDEILDNTNSYLMIGENKSYFVKAEKRNVTQIISIDAEKQTNEIISNLSNIFTKNTVDILPENCRFSFKISPNTNVYVIEEKPTVRTIISTTDIRRDLYTARDNGYLNFYGIEESQIENMNGPYKFQLSFPYIVYVILTNEKHGMIKFNQMCVFYRLNSLKSIYDYLLIPNLPNISDVCKLCTGEKGYIHEGYNTNYDLCQDLIDKFWSSYFNTDLSSNYNKYSRIDSRLENYLSWQYNTLLDPFFINDVNWIKYHKNLEGVIKRFIYIASSGYNISEESSSLTDLDPTIFSNITNQLISGVKISNKFEVIKSSYDAKFEEGFLSAGDSLKIDKNVFFINSFILDSKGVPEEIIVSDENDNINTILINEENRLKINESIIDSKNNSDFYMKNIDINEINIKINDIIKFHDSFIKISSIRKRKDGNIELIYRNSAKNLSIILNNYTKSAISVVDQFEFCNQTLSFNKSYELYHMHYSKCFGSLIGNFKFKDISLSSYDELIFNFVDDDGKIFDLNKAFELDYLISNGETKIKKLDFFCIENSLHSGIDNDILLLEDLNMIVTNDIDKELMVKKRIINYEDYSREFIKNLFYVTTGYQYNEEYQNCLLLTMKKFKYYSLISKKDICLNIGDQVVVSDWDNPNEMLKIKKIKNIIVEPPLNKTLKFAHQGYLNLILEDEDKNEYIMKYVDFSNMMIYDGCVRRAIKSYLEFNINDKVKIKEKNSLFKKSDVFYIAAFVEDIHSDEPFILLSNLTLVKYKNFIKNYEVFSKDDKKYEKLKLSEIPDIKKIKKQCGDRFIVTSESGQYREHYYLNYTSNLKLKQVSASSIILNSKNRYKYYSNSFEKVKFMGFIMERFNNLKLSLPEFNSTESKFNLKCGILDNYNTTILNHPSVSNFNYLIVEKD